MPPKRIEPPCGNPLYLEWLKEWMQEAKAAKNNKSYYVYKKAYESVEKYPIPFQHPAEATILNGIGPTLIQKLERKLSQHCKENSQPMPSRPDEGTKEFNSIENEPKIQKKVTAPKTYVPQYRSGAYAIMLALYKYSEFESTPSVTKAELIKEAQNHCDASFDMPSANQKYYTAWNCMKTLLDKDYVYKNGYPVRFSLTESGLKIAKQLIQTAKLQGKVIFPGFDFDQLEAKKCIESELSLSTNENFYNSKTPIINLENDSETGLDVSDQISISFQFKNQSIIEPSTSTTSSTTNALNAFSNLKPIEWAPGTFEVILILDNREVKLKKDRDYIQDSLQQKGLTISVRNLELGDVIWVARKCNSLSQQELVLDYVIERKRMDDLVGSIKDGRFREQKFRLSRSGMGQIIYLIEDYNLKEVAEFGMDAIKSAMSSTQVLNGFFLKRTSTIDQSIDYLVRMTKMLKKLYENTTLYSIPDGAIYRNNFLDLKQHLATIYANRTFHVSYASYSELNSKSRSLTLKDTFIKLLLTVRGISVEKAAEIVKVYSTPHHLFEAYNSLNNEETKKKMLMEIGGNMIRRRKIGTSLSDKIYQIWNSEIYP
ncbi:12816_t:CDS:2 [Funneliformis geosporum]|uniref:Crossover junction endonuclease MUS81 n=1 Tax=Funneliformis geosporum TaxID=1117311 RepID=A0A9W4WHI0_9GLOM|nr:12722_t:CDS:2 [Funneliformis geosporum]CAI2162270.1 12816_t:CDS:2 [Funneliformis geosporum]